MHFNLTKELSSLFHLWKKKLFDTFYFKEIFKYFLILSEIFQKLINILKITLLSSTTNAILLRIRMQYNFFFLIFYQWFKNDAANYIFKLQSHLKQGLVDIIVMVIFRSWSNFVEEFYKFIPGSSFGWATRQELRPSWSIRRKFIAWTNDDIVQLLLME